VTGDAFKPVAELKCHRSLTECLGLLQCHAFIIYFVCCYVVLTYIILHGQSSLVQKTCQLVTLTALCMVPALWTCDLFEEWVLCYALVEVFTSLLMIESSVLFQIALLARRNSFYIQSV